LNAVFWRLAGLEFPTGGTKGLLPFAIFACFCGIFDLI
jgi:hypothetical protein